MVSLSEFLSVFNYYYVIIYGIIKRSYSEWHFYMKGTKKLSKELPYCTLYIVQSTIA